METKKYIAVVLILLGGFVYASPAWSISINFDDPGLDHLDDITTFYSGLGVEFYGIENPFPIGPGPFPAPPTLPQTTGGAAIWDPNEGTAPGESPPNFAVGMGAGDPGDFGILMAFDMLISKLALTGLDFANSAGDVEDMTLTAYDANGVLIGQEHFEINSVEGAIVGMIAYDNMQYVAFNYTNTQRGFYGIDDLEFTPMDTVIPEPSTMLLLGSGLIGLAMLGRKKFSRT